MKSGARVDWLSFAGLGFALTWTLVSAWSQTSVMVSPKRAAVTATTQTQRFTASVSNVRWSVDSVTRGNTTVGTISTSGLYTPPATGGTHTITATTATVPPISGSATVAVSELVGVLTYHNDLARDGVNFREYAYPRHRDHSDLWQAVLLPCGWRSLRAAALDQGLEHRRRCAQRHFRRHAT